MSCTSKRTITTLDVDVIDSGISTTWGEVVLRVLSNGMRGSSFPETGTSSPGSGIERLERAWPRILFQMADSCDQAVELGPPLARPPPAALACFGASMITPVRTECFRLVTPASTTACPLAPKGSERPGTSFARVSPSCAASRTGRLQVLSILART